MIIDFTDATKWQRVVTPSTYADTRYTPTVLSDGTVQFDMIQQATWFAGLRTKLARSPLQVHMVTAVFSGSFSSSTGLGVTFDAGLGIGADIQLHSLSTVLTWRSYGGLHMYKPDGSTTDMAYTITAGTVPAFFAGDAVSLKLVENGNAVDVTGYKNNIQVFTASVSGMPYGTLTALGRLTGGTGVYPNTQRVTFSFVSSIAPAFQATTIVVNTSPVLGTNGLFGLGRSAPISPVVNTDALIQRAVPSVFSWLPITPTYVMGAGNVVVSKNATAALMAKYPEIISGGVAYVETFGSDSLGVVNDATKPFLTIANALQSSARTLIVGNGIYQFNGDYRSTQAAGGVMKLIAARNPTQVTIRRNGDVLSNLNWTATNSAVWSTTISGSGAWLAGAPHRVRRTDVVDEHGYRTRMPYFAAQTNDVAGVAAAVSALTSAGYGWAWDGATRTLYCAMGGANVQNNRASIEALYRDANGADQILVYGAKLAFDGILFDGQLLWALPSGTTTSEIWTNNCRHFCALGYGIQGDAGSLVVIDNSRIHASALDGINIDSTRGSASTAYGLLAGAYISQSGDTQTYGTLQTSNRQAVSAHSGYFAAFGCLFERNWGQEAADTANAFPSASWYVGCVSRLGDTRQGATTGFSFSGRTAWLDTCATEGESIPLNVDYGGLAKTYNCTFATNTYIPSAP